MLLLDIFYFFSEKPIYTFFCLHIHSEVFNLSVEINQMIFKKSVIPPFLSVN